MKKKKKPTKKQVKYLSIFSSGLAVLWIIRVVDYARDYQVIRQIIADAEAYLVMNILATICWTVLAITWIVQYVKYDEHSKDSDDCVSEE